MNDYTPMTGYRTVVAPPPPPITLSAPASSQLGQLLSKLDGLSDAHLRVINSFVEEVAAITR